MSSPMASLIEPIAPARLGRSFRWLLASAIVDNAGDRIVLSAGPLLLAALTRDPFLVSLAVLARVMPPLLLGVYTVGIYAGIAVGTPIGGLLASQFGLTAPFRFAFVGSAMLVLVLWRQFAHIAHAGAATVDAAAD